MATDKDTSSMSAPLTRPQLAFPLLRRRIAYLLGAVAVALIVAVLKPWPSCERVKSSGPPGLVVLVCKREYLRTGDSATGVVLAEALRQNKERGDAADVANSLLATSVRADATRILGHLALENNDQEGAIAAFEAARRWHRLEQRPVQVARDSHALGGVRLSRGEYAEALRNLHDCIETSRQALAREIEQGCRLAAAATLRRIGNHKLAEKELEGAKQLSNSDRELAQLEYQRGSLKQEADDHKQAIYHFERTIIHNDRAQLRDLTRAAELDLAYSLAKVGKIDEASRQLDRAEARREPGSRDDSATRVSAWIAYQHGDRARASELNQAAYPRISDDNRDRRIQVASLEARIALDEGDLKRAEVWARRGVEQVDELVATQRVVELRSWLMSQWREPFELLFVALARGGQADDAALVLDRWRSRANLDSLVQASRGAPSDLLEAAREIDTLGAWLPVALAAPPGGGAKPSDVLATMHEIDLLVLVVANGEIWRLTASHGPAQIDSLGPLSKMKGRLRRLIEDPIAPEPASELGAILIPDQQFQVTSEALHLLLDDQLSRLPIAALRRNGTVLAAVRPSIRVLSLPTTRCTTTTRTGPATVLAVPTNPANPNANLKTAASEGEAVARYLHTTPEIGARATSARMFAADRNGVLHVASHSELGPATESLVLYDGKVTPAEIVAKRLGPSLVVLPACESASAGHPGGASSLTAAFLAAGTPQVVATLGWIRDQPTLDISLGFYRAGGVADPVRALAKLQAQLASNPSNAEWPKFAVFGHDLCRHGLR